MEKSRCNARPLVIWCWLFLCGLCCPAQTVQPGNPTSPSLPPKYPGDGMGAHPGAKLPSPTLPSGWALNDDGKGCQWAVPGGWYFSQHDVDSLQYADGKGNASLHGMSFTGDWNKYKKRKMKQLGATKVLADSADRLWFQYSKPDNGLHYFVATVGTLFVCTAHIDVTDKLQLKDLTPVANQMATSVRPASP